MEKIFEQDSFKVKENQFSASPPETIVIQCSRLMKEGHSGSHGKVTRTTRLGKKIRSCHYSETRQSHTDANSALKLHRMSKVNIQKEMDVLKQAGENWKADQLYYDWSTCCTIWYPSQNAKGEAQWGHKTPYGEIEHVSKQKGTAQLEELEKMRSSQEVIRQMKQRHTEQQTQFRLHYPSDRFNEREHHHEHMCPCKPRRFIKIENKDNCAVRLTNLPFVTKAAILNLISTGAVVCLHHFKCHSTRISGGWCKIVFQNPESAALLIAESKSKDGLHLGNNRIDVAYEIEGSLAYQQSENYETRILTIKSKHPNFRIEKDDWKVFFSQVCKLNFVLLDWNFKGITFQFCSIDQAKTCATVAKHSPNFQKGKFEMFYPPDPCEIRFRSTHYNA